MTDRATGFSRRTILAGSALAAAGACATTNAPPFLAGGAQDFVRSGRTREYWIQAEPYDADLVPNGRDAFRGLRIDGASNYPGLRYRAYAPGWTSPLPASPAIGENSGIPGPVIRAEVGDDIVVHFHNGDDHYRQPHSLRAHGLDCDVGHDGVWSAEWPDRPGAAVAPGDSHTYRWRAAKSSAGAWAYHDNSRPFRADRPGDPALGANEWMGKALGLIGFIIISEHGETPPDREFFLVVHHPPVREIPPLGIPPCGAVNGRSFLGNTPKLSAKVGERVRWHVMGPNDVGSPRLVYFSHEFHVTGHRWRSGDRWQATTPLFPDAVSTLDWIEDNPGRWLYRSHSIRDVSMYGWYEAEA